jgi:(p)ppGpp synthase/HD superfamily hydrolase
MSIILNGARLADKYHRGHLRDDSGEPYRNHLIRVAGRVAMLDGMEDCDIAASYLHDSREDRAALFGGFITMDEEIRQNCAADTLYIVIALTNPSIAMKGESRQDRKSADREHLSKCPRRVKRIKLIDRDDNLSELYHDLKHGISKRFDFGALYARESELLLQQSLAGADPELEEILAKSIARLSTLCKRT